MPRIKKFVEIMPARFLSGTYARIDAVLAPTEDRAEFVRSAVERELKRRERVAEPRAKHLAPPTARERAARRRA